MGVHKRNQTPIAVSSQRCLASTDFQIDGRLGAAWPACSDASATGEWAGPLVGELGILERDDAGERLQCHICGASFHCLGVHAARAHGVKSARYRALFGLRKGTPLASDPVRAAKRITNARSLVPYQGRIEYLAPAMNPDRRRAINGQPRRREARLDPHNQQVWRELAERGAARLRALGAGVHHRERIQLTCTVCRVAFETPRSRPRHTCCVGCAQTLARSRRVVIACAACGKPIALPPSGAARRRTPTCSRACRTTLKRKVATQHPDP
jgi:hypothetical protein